MEKSLSLFRVFDLSFFASGLVVFLALWHTDTLSREIVDGMKMPLTQAGGLVTALTVIGSVYIVGLVCHGTQRLVEFIIERLSLMLGFRARCLVMHVGEFKNNRDNAHGRWFDGLDKPNRDDLAVYFWYLGTTCWNVATALMIASLLLIVNRFSPSYWYHDVVLAAIVLLPIGALVWLGAECKAARDQAAKRPP